MAVAILGDRTVRSFDRDDPYPVGGAAAAAFALLYRRQVAAHRAIEAAHGKPMDEELELLGRAAADSADRGLLASDFRELLLAAPVTARVVAPVAPAWDAIHLLGGLRQSLSHGDEPPPRRQRARSECSTSGDEEPFRGGSEGFTLGRARRVAYPACD